MFVFKDLGYSNGSNLTEVTVGNVKLTFAKAGGSNAPKFYTSDNSARLYQNNTLTIASIADSQPLTKVVMTFISGKAPQSGVDYGVDLTTSGTVSTWEGSTQSFTLTNNGSDQLRFTQIVVTIGEETVEAPVVTTLSELKALESGTTAWLSLGRDNPGNIEYVYAGTAEEAYVRDNTGAVRFYGFLPDDAGWHTNTGGALIGSVLGEYNLNNGIPEFTHVSASIADSILCLDYWEDPSARVVEQLSDLSGSTKTKAIVF